MAKLKFLTGSEIQFKYDRIKSTLPDMMQYVWYNHFYTSTCIYDDLG